MRIYDNLKLFLIFPILFGAHSKAEDNIFGFCSDYLASVEAVPVRISHRKLSQVETNRFYAQKDSSFWQSSEYVEGKNYIFLQGADETFDEDELMDRWEEAHKPLRPYSRTLRKMGKANSVEECVGIATQRAFDYKKYLGVVEAVQEEIKVIRMEFELHFLNKEIEQFGRNIKKKWIIKKITHLEEIKEVLRSPEVRNVILIGHTKSNGKFVDSFKNELPLNFFKELSPSLYGLGIYGCYSEKMVEVYGLDDIFENSPSHYRRRKLFGVKKIDIADLNQLAPLSRVSNFVRKINRKVNNEVKDDFQGVLTSPQSTCSLNARRISGDSFIPYKIELNRNFIGVTENISSSNKSDFIFPCKWISVKNTLVVTPLTSQRDGFEQFRFQIPQFSPEGIPNLETNIYRDENLGVMSQISNF